MKEWTPENACGLYWKYFYKTTKGINIRAMKNFDKQKADVLKWVCFEKLANTANQNNINLYDYIPLIAAKQKEAGNYFHPKTLISLANLQIWAQKHQRAEQTEAQEKLLEIFMRSFVFVVKFSVINEIDNFSDYINAVIKSKDINIHIASGKLSKYLLSLLPDNWMIHIKEGLDPDVKHQFNEMVLKNKEALCSNTLTALKELRGVEISTSNTLPMLITKNIRKNVTK